MFLRGLAHEGVHSFVQAYPDDAPFLGRARELEQLQKFASGTAAHGLLCAPAGRGKSALLLRLVRALDAAGHAVAWAPISLRFGTHRSLTVDELLTARLRALLGKSGHWRDLITGHDGPPLLLAIDGLDELQDTALLDALADLPLPSSVRLLATARPLLDRDATAWSARLRWSPCDLFDLPPLARHEVSAALPPRPGKHWMDTLMHHTGGDPLLVRICMEALDRDEPLPDVSDPTELVGAWWSDQRARLQAPQGELAARLLGALGAACGVVPWAVLASVVGASEEQAREALLPFARFVIEVPTQGVTFAHPRFAEVARWTFATATQDAHQRFAALALEARQQANPDPYFLHFALPHLEAIGVKDDALGALLTARSLAAWQQHEGSAHGFLREVYALQQRNVRQLAAAWGTDAMPATLERQARLSVLSSVLKRGMIELDPEFLVELVRHGLRSTTQAIQRVSEMRPHQYFRAIHGLLPHLPDSALPALMAIFPEDQGGSIPGLLPRLVQADLWPEAQAYLNGITLQSSHLLAMPAAVSPARLERLRCMVEAKMPREPGYPSLRARLVRLSLLPTDEQRDELARCETLLLRLQASPLDARSNEPELNTSSLLIAEAIRLRQGALALRWLRRGIEIDEAASDFSAAWVNRRINLFFDVWNILTPQEREEAMASVGAWLRERLFSRDALVECAASVPADFPWRESILEQFWEAAFHSPDSLVALLRSPDLPRGMHERATEVLLQSVDAVYEAYMAPSGYQPPEGTPEYVAWDEVLHLMAHSTFPTPAPLFERLPRWLPLNTRFGHTHLLSLMVCNATTEEARAQVRGWLADGTVQADRWLWESANWLYILPADERVTILRNQLRQPLKLPPMVHLFQAVTSLDPNHEDKALEMLTAAVGNAFSSAVLKHCMTSPSILSTMSPQELQHTSDELAALVASTTSDHTVMFGSQALCCMIGRASPLRLARALLEKFALKPLPWFPIEATALSVVPADEARAWVQRCCALPASKDIDLQSWSNSPARWLPDELAALSPGPPLLQWITLPEEEHPRFSPDVLAHANRLLQRMPPALYPELLAQERTYLAYLAISVSMLEAPALLSIAPRLLAARANDFLCDRLTERTAELLYQQSPDQEALEALLQRLAPREFAAPDRPTHANLGGSFLARLWWSRHLPPDQRVEQILGPFERSWWIPPLTIHALRKAGLHEAAARFIVTRQMPPLGRLFVWKNLWPTLAPATRVMLHSALEAAVRAVAIDPHNNHHQPDLLHWGMAQVSDEALRAAWLDESQQTRGEVTIPLEALRRIGGAEAVAAWARGVAEALNMVAAEPEGGARS